MGLDHLFISILPVLSTKTFATLKPKTSRMYHANIKRKRYKPLKKADNIFILFFYLVINSIKKDTKKPNKNKVLLGFYQKVNLMLFNYFPKIL